MPIFATSKMGDKINISATRIAKVSEDTVKVTLEQINCVHRLKNDLMKLKKKEKNGDNKPKKQDFFPVELVLFLKSAPLQLVDECVKLMQEHDLISYHMQSARRYKTKIKENEYPYYVEFKN